MPVRYSFSSTVQDLNNETKYSDDYSTQSEILSFHTYDEGVTWRRILVDFTNFLSNNYGYDLRHRIGIDDNGTFVSVHEIA